MNTNDNPSKLIDEHAVAELLCISVRTLQAWRLRRTGPPFIRVGRAIRYQISALLLWIGTNTCGPAENSGQAASERGAS